MEYRSLGRSGLLVSEIVLGSVPFGTGIGAAWGSLEKEGAARQIDFCFDQGVNMIDTANAYGEDGSSEKVIGELLSENGRRARTLIATKVRFPMGKGPNDRGLSRHHIIAQCEASLKRLRTDVIDLYQVHQWDGLTPVEEMVDALNTLVEHGKVRYIGCSNFSAWHVMKTLAAADQRIKARFVSQQIHYTLHSRDAEYELLPLAHDQGLGVLIWSPLAGGLLSGKYRRDAAPEGGTRHSIGFREPPIGDKERLYDIVEVIMSVAEAHDASGAQVALAWALQRPTITSVVIGGRNQAQIEDNIKAADLKLSPEEVEKLDRVSQPPLLYPYWHQAMTASDRLNASDKVLHGGRVDDWDQKMP